MGTSKRITLRTALVAFFVALMLLLTALPTQAAFAETGSEDRPSRLHFAKAIDSNACTARLVYEVFERMGIDVSFTSEDMSICLRGVNNGIYDGLCSQMYGIENQFDQLVPIPIETSTVSFYVLTLKDDPFECSSWDDLRGKRVGTLSGKTVISNSLPSDVEHIEASSMTQLYDLLRSRQCDVVAITENSYNSAMKLVVPFDIRIAGKTDSRSSTFFVNKKYAYLIDEITQTLEGMEADGSLDRIKAMKPVEDRDEKVVLYLSSYSSEMQWEQHLVEGISGVLNQEKDIEFYNISLNSYRNTNIEQRETEALKDLSVTFIHTPPDAVLVSDNEAMNFLLNNYNSILPSDIPVIACGLNNTTFLAAHQENPYPNISEIVESICAKETVDEMLKLFPATEEIFVINDYTLSGRRWRSEIESQLEPYADRVHVTYNENTSFDDLIDRISSLDENTLILCGSYCLDNTDRYYPQAAVQNSLYEAATVPIFGLLDDSQTHGQLGGMYTNGVLHGEIAATYLVDMLRSDGAGQLTYIEPADDNEWVFNWDVMQEYGISKSQLPQGALVLNAPVSLQEVDPVLYYTFVIGGIAAAVVIVLLIVFALAMRRRNKQLIAAEMESSKSHGETEAVKNHLQTILKNAPIAYSLLVDDIVVESNGHFQKNIGLKIGQKNSSRYSTDGNYDRIMKECREKGFVDNIYWNVITAQGEKARYLYNIARTEHNGQEAIAMWGVNVEQLEQQKEALNQAQHDIQKLTEKAQTDSLTSLFTREASRQFVDEYIWISSETDLSAFMIIDLDNFKMINDTLGHPYGDKVLVEAAAILNRTFRKSDVVMRIGGDEFAVFLKSIPNKEFATDKANELIECFQALDEKEGSRGFLTASIGISFCPENGDSFDALYQKADEALYKAKNSGKNQHAVSAGNGI